MCRIHHWYFLGHAGLNLLHAFGVAGVLILVYFRPLSLPDTTTMLDCLPCLLFLLVCHSWLGRGHLVMLPVLLVRADGLPLSAPTAAHRLENLTLVLLGRPRLRGNNLVACVLWYMSGCFVPSF